VAEQLLPGGFVNRVGRDGDTVRRDPGDRAEFVHQLEAALRDPGPADRVTVETGIDGG